MSRSFASLVLGVLASTLACSSPEDGGATGDPAALTAGPQTAAAVTAAPPATAAPGTSAPATAGEVAEACGERGQPSCPLQGFMKTKMGPTLQRGDLAALAAVLDLVAANPPDPSYEASEPRWSKISQDGAAAARANDTAGARASCKACHTAHQKRFRAEIRRWALPAGMQ